MNNTVSGVGQFFYRRCAILSVILVLCVTSGCATVFIESSPRSDIKLLSSENEVNFSQQFKCWYLFWGLVPVSNNVTAGVLDTYEFKDVRIKSYFSLLDFVVAYFTAGIVVSHSIYIEGNTGKPYDPDK